VIKRRISPPSRPFIHCLGADTVLRQPLRSSPRPILFLRPSSMTSHVRLPAGLMLLYPYIFHNCLTVFADRSRRSKEVLRKANRTTQYEACVGICFAVAGTCIAAGDRDTRWVMCHVTSCRVRVARVGFAIRTWSWVSKWSGRSKRTCPDRYPTAKTDAIWVDMEESYTRCRQQKTTTKAQAGGTPVPS